MKGIENLYKYCLILQNEYIKKEIEDFLKGFTEEENRKLFEYTLKNESGDKISISFKSNYLLHIDGISMDEEHMYTSEKANAEIDKITESTPKRVVKKVLNKLKPKQ